MTIKEMFNANKDMSYNDICVLHCQYDTSYMISDDCVIYNDCYESMPKVLEDLNVLTFERLSDKCSPKEHGKWDIWVV